MSTEFVLDPPISFEEFMAKLPPSFTIVPRTKNFYVVPHEQLHHEGGAYILVYSDEREGSNYGNVGFEAFGANQGQRGKLAFLAIEAHFGCRVMNQYGMTLDEGFGLNGRRPSHDAHPHCRGDRVRPGEGTKAP